MPVPCYCLGREHDPDAPCAAVAYRLGRLHARAWERVVRRHGDLCSPTDCHRLHSEALCAWDDLDTLWEAWSRPAVLRALARLGERIAWRAESRRLLREMLEGQR